MAHSARVSLRPCSPRRRDPCCYAAPRAQLVGRSGVLNVVGLSRGWTLISARHTIAEQSLKRVHLQTRIINTCALIETPTRLYVSRTPPGAWEAQRLGSLQVGWIEPRYVGTTESMVLPSGGGRTRGRRRARNDKRPGGGGEVDPSIREDGNTTHRAQVAAVVALRACVVLGMVVGCVCDAGRQHSSSLCSQHEPPLAPQAQSSSSSRASSSS